jgi:L-alanine-DL-glutamate epimerase-like enolase superfamily enzyme
MNAPNTLIQEVVRAFFTSWYPELATGLPVVEQGMVRPSAGPGHGVDLVPGIERRPDAKVRRTDRGT